MYKNNNIKKLISTILSLVLIISSLVVGMIAYGDDLIAINAARFPDETWRGVVSDYLDLNGDGFLSSSERGRKVLSIGGYLEDDDIIEDLTGIEYFTNLQTLRCAGIGLKAIDLSPFTALVELTCGGNELDALDISRNTNLTKLDCTSNNIKTLNASACKNLEYLDCSSNKLTNLNVAGLTSLKTLYCEDNQLTSLLVYSNTALQKFHCAKNRMWELNLSSNTNLGEITQTMIGDQRVTATAELAGTDVMIAHTFGNKNNLLSTSLDTVTPSTSEDGGDIVHLGYNGIAFVTDEAMNLYVNGVANKVTYDYSVNNPNCESMNVIIDVQRDFYQVNFYTNEFMNERLDFKYVKQGQSVTPPPLSEAPEGKFFSGWSADFDNVQQDINAYIKWVEFHTYIVSAFDEGIVELYCTDCGHVADVLFMDMLNATEEDNEYIDAVDVVKDGIINAKDYAMLWNQFKPGE